NAIFFLSWGRYAGRCLRFSRGVAPDRLRQVPCEAAATAESRTCVPRAIAERPGASNIRRGQHWLDAASVATAIGRPENADAHRLLLQRLVGRGARTAFGRRGWNPGGTRPHQSGTRRERRLRPQPRVTLRP